MVESNDIKVELLPGLVQEVSFSLHGTQDYPLIEAILQPNCSVCAEPGRMIALPEGVEFHTIMGDGTEAGVMGAMMKAGKRMFSGESVFLARFTNTNGEAVTLRFGTVIPGNVLALNLADYGGELIAASGAYLLGSDKLTVECSFKQKLGAAFFGGESFILQRIAGEGGVVLQCGGVVMKEELTPERPTIKIDTGCIVAFTSKLVYNISLSGGMKSWFFGGEGIFLATISLAPGETSGTVWVESFPYSKYISIIKSMYSH
mmetsp:Transcript_81300/g.188867  ORF Transcript_81300/g.188867 Transcript_81300/m.188867 type:complete len:260 (-) Transcript_81300:160-939(-)